MDPKQVLRELLAKTLSVPDLRAEKIVEAIIAAARSDERSTSPIGLTPDPLVARRLNVCGKTITRWDEDPDLDFPPPIEINGRYYRNTEQLNAFIARRLKASLAKRGKKNRPAGESA